MFRLLDKYPALARLWARQVINWIVFTGEFLDHAESFLRRYPISIDANPAKLSDLRMDLGDLHQGNRATLQIRRSDGACWFYKARSGAHELGWFRILHWLNRKGLSYPFLTLNVISNRTHAWMEGVRHRACRSLAEVSAYYFRGGALLYLLHQLRAIDFHAGNLIAVGANPVFVDCETLLHPAILLPAAVRLRERDILRTGLIPIKCGSTRTDQNCSGLGCQRPGPHQVRVGKTPCYANRFLDELESGYRAMNSLLQGGKNWQAFRAVVEESLPPSCRLIRRPTTYYQEILERSLTPRTMMHGFDRSLFLQAACRDGSVPRCCVTQETEALEDGDLPVFHGNALALRKLPSEAKINQSIQLLRDAFVND